MRRDKALDPRPPSGELLLRPPMVGRHPPQEFGSGPVRIDAADVVLPPPRPTVVPFVVPEVEVSPSGTTNGTTVGRGGGRTTSAASIRTGRSEEHTAEIQS